MITITPENLHEYPVGTIVECFYGAYYPIREARVIGHEIVPASKFFPAEARLIIEDEAGNKSTVTRLCINGTDKGIGIYLIELAEKAPSTTKSKSPWSVA